MGCIETLSTRTFDRLAARIHALEDALSLEAGDSHPLLMYERLSEGHAASRPKSLTSRPNDREDAGILLKKDEKTERLLGAQAAEVRSRPPCSRF